MNGWGAAVRIADYDMTGLRMKGDDDAETFVKVAWYRANEGDLRVTTLKQKWHSDAKGDWKRAHECAQEERTPTGSRVHAYLHRVEGDLSNARYWYNRAARPEETCSLQEEWTKLAEELLAA